MLNWKTVTFCTLCVTILMPTRSSYSVAADRARGVSPAPRSARLASVTQPKPSERPAAGPIAAQPHGHEVIVDDEPVFWDWDEDLGYCDDGLEPVWIMPTGNLWWEADYLLWWTKGMAIPPLVTTGTTGALDVPDTRILYGDETILDRARSGFRVGLGSWLSPCGDLGIEGDYWMLGDATGHFRAASDSTGSPRLFRPFFNINPRDGDGVFAPPAREDAEIVSTPQVLAGAVTVDSFSQLHGAGFRVRRRVCCESDCAAACDPCDPCGAAIPRSSRLDLLAGYRYVQLREGLQIREDLRSLLPPPEQGNFALEDAFGTQNSFHGGDLGVAWRRSWGPWLLDMTGRIALGAVEQTVSIRGQTIISGAAADNGAYPGGLLAQRTNIGNYRRNVFAMIPELGIGVGYELTPCLTARVGYDLLYWSRVVRPGDIIDLDVNPDLLPPPEEFAGAARPRFAWRDSDFWAQGIRVGLEGVW